MKMLVNIEANQLNPIPRERMKEVISDHDFTIRAQRETGELECVYKTSSSRAFFILNVESPEHAWKLVMAYLNFPYWLVEMTPLVGVVEFSQFGMDVRNARNARTHSSLAGHAEAATNGTQQQSTVQATRSSTS